MADLDRWNPFKFRRKSNEQKQQEAPRTASSALSPLSRNHPMASLMESFFQDPFFRDPFTRFGEIDRWFGDFSPETFRPSVDVVDEEDAIKVSAELPGMTKDDVQLSIDDDTLTIRGEKRNEEESKENGCYRTERSYGMFQRSIPLPRDVDRDGVNASFDHGVLTVRLPKKGEVESGAKSIEIE
ncbi:MAG TPA: Hsp20/alpha crystallin family protein [Sandaracinaceae bacterium LLY-WYZ-13_1]|nr:Hsp20/alpha crystallin family protein [Sandaracinaceae bacterium LLY-WYZ-13_1]